MTGFSGRRFLKSSLNSTVVPFFSDFHDRWSLCCTWVSYRAPLWACISIQCCVLPLDVEKGSEMPVAWGSCWCLFPGMPSPVTAPSKSLTEASLPRLMLHFFVVHSPLLANFLFQLSIFAKCHRRTQAGDRTRHHVVYVWMGPQMCTDQSQLAWWTWCQWSLVVTCVCHLWMEWLVDAGSSSTVCLWLNYSQWIFPSDEISTMLWGCY